ncbi:MAG: sodium:solute symporter family protein [Bacillota bacterium]|nr:sodium:solute symporter family protein [Bacillota bacterium]
MSEFTIVITIIFVFTFVPLILAEVARNKSLPSVEDFFVYSRSMPTLLCFFTIYGTWYSTFAVVGSSAYFYFKGPVYMTTFAWNALFAVCFFILGRRIWFYGKRHNYITPTDFFSDIYKSKALNILVTIIMLVFTLPYIQIQFSGGAYLLEIASRGQIPWEIAGIMFYTIMVVYLWAGGIRAVALTDIFFGILVFFTMLGTGILLADKAGGVEHIFDILIQDSVDNVTLSGKDPFNNVALWMAMFLVTPLGAIMSPPMWIRSYSVKKEKSFYLLPFLLTLAAAGYIGCFISGNAGRVLKSGLTNSDMLIPTLLTEYGSQILTTLLFCGFAAASLSTANSQIHALSAIYTIDIHKRWINRDVSDSRLLYIAKWAVLGVSALTYVLMIASPAIIISTGLLALSGTMQLLVPTVGALFWKKSNATGAFAGLLGGSLTLTVLHLGFHLESSYCGVIGLAVNAVLFIILCNTTKQSSVTRDKLISYHNAFIKRNDPQKKK